MRPWADRLVASRSVHTLTHDMPQGAWSSNSAAKRSLHTGQLHMEPVDNAVRGWSHRGPPGLQKGHHPGCMRLMRRLLPSRTTLDEPSVVQDCYQPALCALDWLRAVVLEQCSWMRAASPHQQFDGVPGVVDTYWAHPGGLHALFSSRADPLGHGRELGGKPCVHSSRPT